jgi:hypothetical protein
LSLAKADITCYFCKKEEHLQKDCKLYKKAKRQIQEKKKRRDNSESESFGDEKSKKRGKARANFVEVARSARARLARPGLITGRVLIAKQIKDASI